MTDSRKISWWPGRSTRHLQRELVILEQQNAVAKAQLNDLRRILASLGEGVVAVDNAGIVVHANRAAHALLDMDPEAGIGSHMFVAVPHQGICHALEDTMRAGAEATTIQREISMTLHGIERVYSVQCRPLRRMGEREDRIFEGAIAVVRDVTDIRRLERTRQDFLANVSHELKTPITAIRGALETILDDEEMARETQSKFLASSVKDAERLTSLVRDILSLERLEAGDTALNYTNIDIAKLVAEIIVGSEATAQRRGVRLTIEQPANSEELIVHADEEALRQAIDNLVDNAVSHSESGDRVVVSYRRRGSDTVIVRVTDTGPGIPEDALDRIFERFYRVDAARSRERGGTGIGLSIVKHVAASHGGVITVSSVLGEGSTFELVLPVSFSR